MNGERAPTDKELAVLEIWLRHQADAAQSLCDQLGYPFTVSPSCGCGCASIAFDLSADAAHHRLPADGTYEVEGIVETDDTFGGLMLFIREGLVAEIDAHSYGDSPLLFPGPESVRWGSRRGEHTVVPFDTELVVRAADVSDLMGTVRSRFPSLDRSDCRWAAVTTVHDEYDVETGHVGPLRSYVYFFAPDGRRIPRAFIDAESVVDAVRIAEALGVPQPAWVETEAAMDVEGHLPHSVRDRLEAQDRLQQARHTR